MNRRSHPLAALLVFLAACGGDRPPTSPGVPLAPSLQLSDGRSGGNKDFFFLPPLAANPSGHPNFSAGQFNAKLKPTVEICPLSLNKKGVLQQVPAPDQHCASPTRVFSKAAVTLVAAEQLYQANWKVDESTIDVSRIYRIRVFVENRELGFVDVDPVTKTEYRRYPTGENIPLSTGRTLPIKFRIENGALVTPGATDYVEANVPQTGGTNTAVVIKNGVPIQLEGTLVTTNQGTAAAFFPNEWLPAGYPDGVLVKIVRVPVGPDNNCHGVAGTGLLQYEGCYAYTTEPEIPFMQPQGEGAPQYQAFAKAVYVAQCAEFRNAAEARVRGGILFKSSAREPLTPLPPVVPSFLPACGEYSGTTTRTAASTDDGAIVSRDASSRFAAATWKALTSRVVDLLTPRSAIAFDLGVGGQAFAFSNIGYGVRTAVVVAGGDAQTGGTVGRPLGTPVSVRVVAQHEHADGGIDLEPLPGVVVTFTPQDGGSAAPITATSGADGIASATWTLGTATTHTLIASIPSPSSRPYGGASQVTFTATAGGTGLPALAVAGIASLPGNGGGLLLTPGNPAAGGAGAAWHPTPLQLSGGFTTSFTFRIDGPGFSGVRDSVYRDPVNPNGGADGFAFVIQNSPSNPTQALGGAGGSLGYGGIRNSVAVEFDTWDSDSPDLGFLDPNANHIAIHAAQSDTNSALALARIGGAETPAINMSDSAVHTARITYTPPTSNSEVGTLSVTLDGSPTPALTRSVTLSLGGALSATGTAYVGFTAATGLATENHRILSWTLPTSP
jgi:hypothetical protein